MLLISACGLPYRSSLTQKFMERTMTESSVPKTYEIHLTKEEMQMVINAVTGFYRVMEREKTAISPEQTAQVLNAFMKMKKVIDDATLIHT